MKSLLPLILLTFWTFSCTSFDSKAIVEDICLCNSELIQINKKIKEKIDQGAQKEIMSLFVEAGEIHEQTKNCILSLSNTYGHLTSENHEAILVVLGKKCKDAIEPYEISGWYKKKSK